MVPGYIRFTPTGVGTTTSLSTPPLATNWFTPTGVGTTSPAGVAGWPSRGSPPRVWGQRSGGRRQSACGSVHPHGCGDNWYTGIPAAPAINGSPPRVWGQLAEAVQGGLPQGGSPPRVWGQQIEAAYPTARWIGSPPRVWGQRCLCLGEQGRHYGSPPRVWGQRLPCRSPLHKLSRFTPTGVGTTGCAELSRPRVTGSPPRVWGQREVPPALCKGCSVHPHGCGDNLQESGSPHQRSWFTPTGVGTTLPRLSAVHSSGWFTPTGVGTTVGILLEPLPLFRFTPTGVGTTTLGIQ